MEVLTILETTTLMASCLRHNGQIQSLQHQNLAPWHKTAFDIAQIFFASFYFIFEDRNFGVNDKTLVDQLTFKFKE